MRTERAYGGRSFKAQMKVADRSGARFAVVLGRQEAEHAAVSVKDMQSGDQVEVPRELVAGWLQERLEADPRRELDSKR
jgi:histidyl-tRNA synthetase